MAAIDKIYGTLEQFDEFYQFIENNKPGFLKYFYPRWEEGEGPIANMGTYADNWLLRHCKIDFVQERLKDQYNGNFSCVDPDLPSEKLEELLSNLCEGIPNFMGIELWWDKTYEYWKGQISLDKYDYDMNPLIAYNESGSCLHEVLWELCSAISKAE